MKIKKLLLSFVLLFSFFYGKTQIVVDCDNEEVGIGFNLTTPSSDVHVLGNTRFQPSSSSSNSLLISTNASYGWSLNPSSNYLGAIAYYSIIQSINAKYIYGENISESDRNVKKNILNLYDALPIIKKLRPVSFDYNYDYSEVEATKVRSKMEATDKNRLGFIAQEVRDILPQSVLTKEPDSTLCIRMDDFIPLLVKGMQEQQAQIDSLINVINSSKSEDIIKSAQIGSVDMNSNSEAKLEQNNPNPFNEQTTINCFIPTNSSDARLLVFNMQGTLVKSYQISGRNEASVTIAGAELNAGMYIYSLVIDNKEIDSKRMILSN